MIIYVPKLLRFLDSWSRREVILLCAAMLGMMFLEMIGIGLFLPLMQAIIEPERISNYSLFQEFPEIFNSQNPHLITVVLAVVVFVFFVIKNVALLLLVWFQYRFVNNKISEFSAQLLKIYLAKPYQFHLRRNSSELIRNTHSSVSTIFLGGLVSILNILLESLMISGVIIVLFLVAPAVTLSAISFLGLIMFSYYRLVRGRVENYGRIKQTKVALCLKWLSQSFGSIKETKILGREDFFVAAFARPLQQLAQIDSRERVITRAIGSVNEVVLLAGLVAILTSTIVFSDETSPAGLLPILGLFAVAGFRLIPSINRITISSIVLRNSLGAIDDVYSDIFEDDIEEIPTNNSPIWEKLKKGINLDNVELRYEGTETPSVSNVSMTISKGEFVAFVGSSGAGKTSLADIILGLSPPTKGRVLVDGKDVRENIRGWQNELGYVPQHIYLLDDTLRRNVAFGLKDAEISEEAVVKAIDLARLDTFVASLPEGLDTMVGEAGVRLSGGQRQRIGIARAIYHDPDVLIFDEATSALDDEIEQEIAQAIKKFRGEKTLIVIAHKLSTIRNADVLYFLEEGFIIGSGSFDDLRSSNTKFRKMALIGAKPDQGQESNRL